MGMKRNDFDAVGAGRMTDTELSKAFGPEPEPATLPIDWAYLKAAKLSAVSFTECTVTDFHEGEHKGLRFSAANVELRRTVEEKSGPDNDNWMTRTETLFRGIVVRCKDICDTALDIDGIRKWFIASLTGMGNLLDLITESPALTGTTE